MTIGRIFRRQRSPENVRSKELAEQLRKEVLELVDKLGSFSQDVQKEIQELEASSNDGESR